LKVPGLYNIYNTLATISIAREINCEFEEIIMALEQFKPVPMRMQQVEINGITIFNDAFNANPQSVLAALETFDKFTCLGKKVVILGDMLELGLKSAVLHRNVGKNLPESINILITVGEQAKHITEGAKEADKKLSAIFVCNSPQEATDKLVDILKNNDKILIKGSRLMKLEEIVTRLQEKFKDADK
jgi:UDP-N-acetylmuramoyl-tripeptide--D-alanyl-D-alanine ligase